MSITVLNSGLLTTVQDLGRIGYQQFGVSVSGAVDSKSASLANILVGNEVNEAVLECTILGPKLCFNRDNCFAICGGDLGAFLDGQAVTSYRVYAAKAGQILKFTAVKSGCRAYIAFSGGLEVPMIMGSRSTYMRAKIGGVNGRKLEKNDIIAFRSPKATLTDIDERYLFPEFIPKSEYVLKVLLGPQDDYFTDLGIATFLSQTYTVTQEFDRMGCRLDGDIIASKHGGDIISDGISFGAIQIASDGKPIIMLADRQTTGGYTKIANVITSDFRILGQLKAGDKVKFEKVSIDFAQNLFILQKNALRTLAMKNRKCRS